ncbi:MAG: hypothetical protein WC489_07355 [Patescibacteria group bacterium]|jgi:hypothetical protein
MATERNSFALGAALYFGGQSAQVVVYEGTYGDPGDDGYRAFTASDKHTLLSLHGWDVLAGWEYEEEFAQDSTFREGVARHHFRVDVNATYGRFLPDIDTWLASKMMNPGGTADAGKVEDSSYVALFQFIGLATSFNGNMLSQPLRISVDEVYFENYNLPVQENKFIHVPLKGHGRTVKYENASAFPE